MTKVVRGQGAWPQLRGQVATHFLGGRVPSGGKNLLRGVPLRGQGAKTFLRSKNPRGRGTKEKTANVFLGGMTLRVVAKTFFRGKVFWGARPLRGRPLLPNYLAKNMHSRIDMRTDAPLRSSRTPFKYAYQSSFYVLLFLCVTNRRVITPPSGGRALPYLGGGLLTFSHIFGSERRLRRAFWEGEFFLQYFRQVCNIVTIHDISKNAQLKWWKTCIKIYGG